MPLGNLALRSITGAIFGTVVIGSILWHPYAQMAVFSVFMVIGLAEFYRLFKNHPVVEVSSEIPGLSIAITTTLPLDKFLPESLISLSTILNCKPCSISLAANETDRSSSPSTIHIIASSSTSLPSALAAKHLLD